MALYKQVRRAMALRDRADEKWNQRKARLDQLIVELRKYILAKMAVCGHMHWDSGGLQRDQYLGPKFWPCQSTQRLRFLYKTMTMTTSTFGYSTYAVVTRPLPSTTLLEPQVVQNQVGQHHGSRHECRAPCHVGTAIR